MQKEQLLKELSSLVKSGDITKKDIDAVYAHADTGSSPAHPKKKSISVTNMLYVLGGAVVVIGLMLFVAQLWNDLGSFGRIAVTLGLGLAMAGIGSLLLAQKDSKHSPLGAVFHIIGGVLMPGGIVVTLAEMNMTSGSLWPHTFAFGALFIFYFLLHIIQRHPAITLFAITSWTTFLYLFVNTFVDGPSYHYLRGDVNAYLTLALGASYVMMARAFKHSWHPQLIRLLHFFGTFAFLAAGFSRVSDSVFWQFAFTIITFGGIYLATVLKSTSMLFFSTLFLIFHIAFITNEYFADSLGWPISLVLIGLACIGLGYASVTLNKTYISTS